MEREIRRRVPTGCEPVPFGSGGRRRNRPNLNGRKELGREREGEVLLVVLYCSPPNGAFRRDRPRTKSSHQGLDNVSILGSLRLGDGHGAHREDCRLTMPCPAIHLSTSMTRSRPASPPRSPPSRRRAAAAYRGMSVPSNRLAASSRSPTAHNVSPRTAAIPARTSVARGSIHGIFSFSRRCTSR